MIPRVRWEAVLSTLLTVAALAVASSLVKMAFFPDGSVPVATAPVQQRPTFIDGWEDLLGDAVRLETRIRRSR